MSGERPRLRFDLEWRITLFTAVLVPLMIGLGFWQLQRAAQKASLASAFEARQQQSPAPVSVLWKESTARLAYAPVELRGRFLPDRYFLLDNQVRGGQFGYEVLHIFRLEHEQGSVLVNRGWVEGDASRQSLPVVHGVDGEVAVTGHVYVAPGAPFLLAEQQLDVGWPKRIQAIELEWLSPVLAQESPGPVFPHSVRINAGQSGALDAQWQVVNMSPQKHQGYAVQWFAMAAALFLYYLFRSSNAWQVLTGPGREGE